MEKNWLNDLFRVAKERRASDLHLRVPSPPVLRIDGDIVPIQDFPSLKPGDIEDALGQITTPEQRAAFDRDMELDFHLAVPGLCRFRVNGLRQRGSVSLAFRVVPLEVPTIDGLGLPQAFKALALKRRGLVLVTGPTGSGKTTTLAAMIDHLNENSARNIVSIEDPIEYVHRNKRSLIAQRNLGEDTRSFSRALKHALRHDVDTIVVGEIRDPDTINAAIMAAETGHMVFGTVHTVDAIRSIDRVVDICPAEQRRQLRFQLSNAVEAIISQLLLPRIGGGQVAAFEIVMANGAVRDIIRQERTAELPRHMSFGSRDEGMQTLDQSLADLVVKGIVSKQEAMARSSNPHQLNNLLLDAQWPVPATNA